MKESINKIFDDFLSKQTIKTSEDFYENLMNKINSQDEIIENNFDSFLNKKISTNIDFAAKITKSKSNFKLVKLIKHAACFSICLIGVSAYFWGDLTKEHNKTSEIDLYADAIFFSNESLADISEVSSQNALDMLNYFASTSL